MVESRAQHIDPSQKALRSPWLNRKRLEFWLLWGVLAYAILGFFVAPSLIKTMVINRFSDDFGLQARVDDIDLNPFTLSLSARGFAVDDQQGQPLLAIDDLFVNYQVSSLFLRARIAKNVRIAGASANFIRYAPGDTNFSRAFKSEAGEIDQATQSGLPSIRIDQLEFERGSLDLTDEVPETNFHTSVAPINFSVTNLNTMPGMSGTQSVHITTEHGGSLQWTGNLQIQPFQSSGHAELAGTHLSLVRKYLQDQFEFELSDSETIIDFDYKIVTRAEHEPELSVDALNLRIKDLSLGPIGADAESVRIPELEVRGGSFHWPAQKAQVQTLLISDATINVVRNADGKIDLAELLISSSGADSPAAADSVTRPWDIVVNRFDINGMGINLADHIPSQPASLEIGSLNLSVEKFSNATGAMSAVALDFSLGSGGRISARGDFGLFPGLNYNTALKFAGVSLLPAQPYILEFARIELQDGQFDLSATLSSSAQDQLQFDGQFNITNLELTDSDREQRFAGWKSFNIDKMSLNTGQRSIEISEIELVEPYGRVDIAADQSTNLGRIFANAESAPEPAAATTREKPYSLTLGRISVENGSANFSDASLPLTFATEIRQLNGEISTFVSGSSEPALVSMEGQIDEYGLTRIEGTIDLLAPTEQTDMTINFHNLEMQSLNPYTIAFAGRKIDGGKLDLELDYLFAARKLKGENNIVIKDIVLGDKVDQPGAMDLPLDLAVALLKGANGEINIDLPVSGNLDDPEFSYGGIVIKALAGLIIKAVASPFRLLGRLVGDDSEDFDQIRFLPGQSTLTPPELEKVHKLAEALQMRPEISAQIHGVFDPVVDRLALQTLSLENALEQRLVTSEAGNEHAMLLEQTRTVIEDMYTALPEHDSLEDLRQRFTAADPADGGNPALDELAYVTEMKNQLITALPVADAELESLASNRAATIINAINEKTPGSRERLSLTVNRKVTAVDELWITSQLELAPNSVP